jgi:sialate O-acetylesterase
MRGAACDDAPMHHLPRVAASAARISAAFLWLVTAPLSASADVSLDTPFQDHAVLQRDREIRVTGRAEPNEALTLVFGDTRVEGRADAEGRFALMLAAMPASLEPRDLAVEGASGRASAKDILVGEVWFCSGQSNMEWTVDGANEAARAKSFAARMPIRSYKAPHTTANKPAARVAGAWRVASPETVGGFTAVGFWFGVDLARAFDLEVPIGLVDISWGGTRIEPWIPLDAMAKSDFSKTADDLAARIAAFDAEPEPDAKAPGTQPHEPAAIYNAMMAPWIAYPVRGAIWYQGESNAGEPDNYRRLLPLLMRAWREKSGNPDMAWGVVQLASFQPFVENEPAQGGWALLREAQFRGAREAGNAGMISAIDLGDAADIHPRRKREVGERLAAWARHTVYGESAVAWQGPELADAARENGAMVRVRFHHAQGLRALGEKPGGFALAGADGRFVWADASIMDEGRDGIVLTAPGVDEPVEVAYAWQNNPERANIVNGAGLPLVPFRVKIAAAEGAR